MKTRERIISAVVKAFNQNGYHAWSLTDLAQKCGMSRGNLAYHYKYKEDILDDISFKMEKDIKRFFKKHKSFPAFHNLSNDIGTCKYLQKNYAFVFRDMSVLEHASIREVLNRWSKAVIKRNISAFAYGIEVGNIKPEKYDGLYYQLALNSWQVTFYWVAQHAVRDMGGDDDAERMVWSTILPHFTEKGIEAFEKFYGADYMQKLGIPIGQFKELQHLI